MDPNKHKIFVYGVLKKGKYWHNEYLGKDQGKFLGVGFSGNEFSLYVDALPFMVREDSKDGVKGEIYEVDADVLKRIDKLEGCPFSVNRELVKVKDSSNETVWAWAYVHHNIFKGKKHIFKETEWD